MANILPECLIHEILSHLSFKEATKMSIVSKTWLQAWLTHPYLDFTVHRYRWYTKHGKESVDKILERYRDKNIPVEKFKFLNYSHSNELDPLIDKWLDIALHNGVKELVYSCDSRWSRSYALPVYTILTSKTLTELVLMGCDLRHLSSCISPHVTNCNSLRKLSLSRVSLDDNALQALLNKCPLIVNFIFENCSYLEKIELRNHQKIRSVSVQSGTKIKIEALTLEHLSCSINSFEELYIVECQNLKSLELSCGRLSDGILLEHLISRFQFLESLTLYRVYKGSERFNVCGNQSLRVLKIQSCSGIGEIDAPNLVSLVYLGKEIPDLKIESNLKHSDIRLECFGSDLNARWFCKLRTLLSNSTGCSSHVSLSFDKCSEINQKKLKLLHAVAIPQVDVLDVRITNGNSCPTFVDALLWSCHPRRLNLRFSTVETIVCFMYRLMHMKNSSDSTQLKEVKAYKLDHKNQPVELKSGELTMRNHRKELSACFLLDW